MQFGGFVMSTLMFKMVTRNVCCSGKTKFIRLSLEKEGIAWHNISTISEGKVMGDIYKTLCPELSTLKVDLAKGGTD